MNLESCREQAKTLLYAVDLEPNPDFPMIMCHPYSNSPIMTVKSDKGYDMVDITTEEGKERFYATVLSVLDSRDNFGSILNYINKPYRLFYLKCCKEFMDNKEFSKYFAEVWVMSENPNQDVNVSLKEMAKWFEKADKESLMEAEDYKVYCNMPDEFDIYRGVSRGRNPKGFSWTRSYEKAEWFANRYGKGYVQKAHIKKEQVYCYFNTRDEDEYVVNSYKLQNIEIM